MVREDGEASAFEEVPEVLDGEVDAEEFPVERGIIALRFAELAAVER